jgi:phage internal scaffolding protein
MSDEIEVVKRVVSTRENGSRRVQKCFNKPTKTKRGMEFKRQCDINHILKRCEKTGMLPTRRAQPIYGDLPATDDYHSAMNIVAEVKQSFDLLPSSIRKEFGNDVNKFLAFANDPNNIEAMADLGLVELVRDTEAPIPSGKQEDALASVVEPQSGGTGESEANVAS